MISSRFREVIVIHQQLVPFRPTPFQDHLVLETNLPSRLILYWITLSLVGPNELSYNRYAWKSGRGRCIYVDDSRSFRRDV